MQEKEKLQEIENLGEDEQWSDMGEEEPPQRSHTVVPLIQAAVCAIVLIALVWLKLSAPEQYEEVRERYHQEASRIIQLPQWEGAASPQPSPTPSLPPVSTPTVNEGLGGLQRV